MDVESPSKCTRWPILRCRPGHDYVVELLSSEWLRLTTHFAGRTILCSQSGGCELCDILPARAFWYLPAFLEPQRRAVLLELSSSAAADLEQSAKFESGTVREGLRFRLHRRTAKAALRAEALSASESPRRSELAEWASLVMVIYGLPAIRPDERLEEYGQRVRPTLDSRAAMIAARLRAGQKVGINSR